MAVTRLPLAPLEERIAKRPGPLNSAGSSVARAYHRARTQGGATVPAADQLAVALLGLHPAEVWGELWWEAR